MHKTYIVRILLSTEIHTIFVMTDEKRSRKNVLRVWCWKFLSGALIVGGLRFEI